MSQHKRQTVAFCHAQLLYNMMIPSVSLKHMQIALIHGAQAMPMMSGCAKLSAFTPNNACFPYREVTAEQFCRSPPFTNQHSCPVPNSGTPYQVVHNNYYKGKLLGKKKTKVITRNSPYRGLVRCAMMLKAQLRLLACNWWL